MRVALENHLPCSLLSNSQLLSLAIPRPSEGGSSSFVARASPSLLDSGSTQVAGRS